MKKKEFKLWQGVAFLILAHWISTQFDLWLLGEVVLK